MAEGDPEVLCCQRVAEESKMVARARKMVKRSSPPIAAVMSAPTGDVGDEAVQQIVERPACPVERFPLPLAGAHGLGCGLSALVKAEPEARQLQLVAAALESHDKPMTAGMCADFMRHRGVKPVCAEWGRLQGHPIMRPPELPPVQYPTSCGALCRASTDSRLVDLQSYLLSRLERELRSLKMPRLILEVVGRGFFVLCGWKSGVGHIKIRAIFNGAIVVEGGVLRMVRRSFVRQVAPNGARFKLFSAAPFSFAFLGAFAHQGEDRWSAGLLRSLGDIVGDINFRARGHNINRLGFDSFVVPVEEPKFDFEVNLLVMVEARQARAQREAAPDFLGGIGVAPRTTRADATRSGDDEDLERWLDEVLDEAGWADFRFVAKAAEGIGEEGRAEQEAELQVGNNGGREEEEEEDTDNEGVVAEAVGNGEGGVKKNCVGMRLPPKLTHNAIQQIVLHRRLQTAMCMD